MLCPGDFESTLFWLKDSIVSGSASGASGISSPWGGRSSADFINDFSFSPMILDEERNRQMLNSFETSIRAQAQAFGIRNWLQLKVFKKILIVESQDTEVDLSVSFFHQIRASAPQTTNMKAVVLNFWLSSLFSDLSDFSTYNTVSVQETVNDTDWGFKLLRNLLNICTEGNKNSCIFFIFLTGLCQLSEKAVRSLETNFNRLTKEFSSCNVYLVSILRSPALISPNSKTCKVLLALFSNVPTDSGTLDFGNFTPKFETGSADTLAIQRQKRLVTEVYGHDPRTIPSQVQTEPSLACLPELLSTLKKQMAALPSFPEVSAEYADFQVLEKDLFEPQRQAFMALNERCLSMLYDFDQHRKAWRHFSLQHAILYGPSGSGKSHVINLFKQKYRGLNFAVLPVVKLYSKYVGEAEENLKKLFNVARQKQPCVIVLEGIDAIAAPRELRSEDQGDETSSNLLTTLLLALDSVDKNEEEKVLVLATSLLPPDKLDAALTRPGRLGYHVGIEKTW